MSDRFEDIPPELQFPRRPFDAVDLLNLVWALEWQKAGMTLPPDPFDEETS